MKELLLVLFPAVTVSVFVIPGKKIIFVIVMLVVRHLILKNNYICYAK